MSKKKKKPVEVAPEVEEVVQARVVRRIEIPLSAKLRTAAEHNPQGGLAQAFLRAQKPKT